MTNSPALLHRHHSLWFLPGPALLGQILLVSLLVQNSRAEPATEASNLDWYPREQLSPEQQSRIATGCCGAYVDPLATPPIQGSRTTADENVHISGKESQITKNSTLVTGDVELEQGERKLTGDRAEIFNDPQSVQLEGHVTYREPGFLLEGSSATVNLEKDELAIESARYVLHEHRVHGDAGQIRRSEDGIVYLMDSTYSTCEPADPLWKFRSHAMTLDTEHGQGTASHVRLEVGSVPVFYFPYLRFPISDQRQSGFLAPSFTSSENGLDISLPYYFNLAPHYDLTVIPRSIADRGAQLGGEFRHLSGNFDSVISAAFLNHDKKTGEDRWLAAIEQTGGAHQPWFTHIDVARVSDTDYFEDLDDSGLSVRQTTHLKQAGSAGYMTEHWDTWIEAETFQILRDSNNLDDPYDKFPDVAARGTYALNHGFSTTLSQQMTHFDHSDDTQVTGNRLSADYTLRWRNHHEAFRVEPALNLYYRGQRLDNSPANDSPEALVPGITLDTGLVMENTHGRYLKTFEPRLFYAYTDYESQDDIQLFDTDEIEFDYAQLYESNRFAGGDRVADTHQTTLGFSTRWIAQPSNHEWMRFGAGQVFYHADRRINGFDTATFALLPAEYREQYTRSRSPLAAQWQWFFHPDWQLDSELVWDENKGKTEQGHLFLHYQNINKELFSLGYRHTTLLTEVNATTYIVETLRQAHLSTYWPFSNQWALMGGLQYDFSHQRSLETMVGIQYEDCCWRLRTLYRQWEANPNEVFDTALHEEQRGIYLEIQFKGLASTGKKIASLLEDNVYGYDSND